VAEPAKPAIAERTDAEAKILEKVGVRPENQKESYTRKDFYKDFVDKLDPIKEFEVLGVGKKGSDALPVAESPYKLARMVNDSKAKAKHVIERGTIDFKTLETNGKGLAEIIEPHKTDLNGLRAFLVAERAIELEASGRKSGFDLGAANQVVKEGSAKYSETARALIEFQDKNLQYLRDSGRVSPAAYAAMKRLGRKYIPFSRLVSDEGGAGGGKGGLKRLKGSDLAIQDPFVSILENTESIFKMAESNRARIQMLKFAQERGAPGLVTKVKKEMRPIEIRSEEVTRALEDAGFIVTEGSVKRTMRERGLKFTDEQIAKALENEPNVRDVAEGFTVFRQQNKDLAVNQFDVYINGKREIFEVADPSLAQALKDLDGAAPVQNILMKIARQFTAVKRIGITLTPDFIVRNALRDQMTAGVFSKQGTVPFADMMVAIGDLWKKNDVYYEWLKSGGANGAFLELNSKYLENSIYKLDQQTGIINQTMNALRNPLETLSIIPSIIESAPRLAEFKRTSKKLGTLEGGFASREITIDFQRVGAKMAALNSITAFQNVQIQGLDRTVRALKENPTDVAIKTGAYVVAPSVLLWWAQHDDPRYKEIPRWQKDLHWIVLTDDWQKAENEDEYSGLPEYMVRKQNGMVEVNRGTIYRIPKPQELGMVGSLVERVLEKFAGDNPNAGKDLFETVQEMVIPGLIPDAVRPALEQATNYNTFTKRPLIPQYLEAQLPAFQYTDYTSETAKALGKILGSIPLVQESGGASPMVIENYVRGWTGTLGSYALQLADAGLIATGAVEDPVRPAWAVADIPAVKAFVIRYPSAQAQSIQDFYDQHERTEKIVNSLREQMKRGNPEEVDFIMEEYDGQIMSLKEYKDALSKQSQFIRSVQRQKDWTPEEKRQLIDTTYYQMIEISKQGLEAARAMEKTIEGEYVSGEE
jgi:hypothetical protein